MFNKDQAQEDPGRCKGYFLDHIVKTGTRKRSSSTYRYYSYRLVFRGLIYALGFTLGVVGLRNHRVSLGLGRSGSCYSLSLNCAHGAEIKGRVTILQLKKKTPGIPIKA